MLAALFVLCAQAHAAVSPLPGQAVGGLHQLCSVRRSQYAHTERTQYISQQDRCRHKHAAIADAAAVTVAGAAAATAAAATVGECPRATSH